MNSNRGKENYIIEQVAQYLAKRGNIPSSLDYNRDSNRPKLTTLKEINKYVGGWQVLLDKIKSTKPDLWEQAQPKAKAAPKAKAKPATKVANKKEK